MMIRDYLRKPEDFFVEEVIEHTPKYKRTRLGIEKAGKYTLFVLEKKEMTTHEALNIIEKNLSVKKTDIGYAGLKDKFAVTRQFITVKGNHAGFVENNMVLKKVGNREKSLKVGELLGNRFVITLHGMKINRIKYKNFPNFFGEQRFGAAGDNCIIGKLILQRRYDEASELIKTQNHFFRKINDFDKNKIKFYIHAYQSFVFNETLKEYMKKNSINGKEGDIIGYNTTPKNKKFFNMSLSSMKKDSINQKSFRFDDLRIMCNGATRRLSVEAKELECFTEKEKTVLKFFLPKGSYGTVFAEFLLGEKPKNR